MNQEKFKEYREKYREFIYHSYTYEQKEDLKIEYYFEIPGLCEFHPRIILEHLGTKQVPSKDHLEALIFRLGMIELISYVKATCSKKIKIEAGYLEKEEIPFYQKLYWNGLGEFLYRNGIETTEEELFEFECFHEETTLPKITYEKAGNLICVGGGKDSCVSLELLKKEPGNVCLLMNPKTPSIECAKIAGYEKDNMVFVDRILDPKIKELNEKGFLNGHTPLSSLIAFLSYLCAYLIGVKNIVLSNEASANESTVKNTNVNHQYSKTLEFENDFRKYMDDFIGLEINYFSLLRGLSEYNIAKLFSNYKKYHPVFRSCNLGSKEKEWKWCCNCPKCLFIYIILTPHLTKKERIEIFGEDLLDRKDLLNTFLELLGYQETKPFECVGTMQEARLCVSLAIEKGEEAYLLHYYKEHFPLELDKKEVEAYQEENNVEKYYETIIKEELKRYDK